jgi:hypothetical protein
MCLYFNTLWGKNANQRAEKPHFCRAIFHTLIYSGFSVSLRHAVKSAVFIANPTCAIAIAAGCGIPESIATPASAARRAGAQGFEAGTSDPVGVSAVWHFVHLRFGK